MTEFPQLFYPILGQDVIWISAVMQYNNLPHHGLDFQRHPIRTLFLSIYQTYYVSANCKALLVCEISLTECPPFLLSEICGYCVVH